MVVSITDRDGATGNLMLVNSDGSIDTNAKIYNTSDVQINPATEETVSQLVQTITNAIDETAFDLNAAAFSETTSITNDYQLDSIEFNFTTTQSRDITITSADGTVIFKEAINTDTSFVWQPSSELAFNGGENLTIDVTQTAGACSMDCILKIIQGSNSLLGNPYVGWQDTDGNTHGFQQADGRPRISTVEYMQEISKGNLTGHIHLWGFGEREDMQVDVRGEDVWRGTAARIPHPEAINGEQMTVVSSDAQDGVAGIGVLTIIIEYIDSNGLSQTESKTMNGTTGVNTSATDITFVNHVYATSVGSNGVAVGQIDVHKLGDDTTVYNLISLGGNKSLSCILRVPNNKTFYIQEWHGSVAGNKPTIIRLRSTDWDNILYNGNDPVFLFKDTAFIAEGNFDRHFTPPIRVPGGTTIKVSGWATQAGVFVSASINGFYE